MMSNDTAIASRKEKIDDLNQQAWNVRVSDSQKSFELSKEAVELARSINYAKGLAEGLQNCGLGYIRLSKNDEAVTVLKEALPLFRSLNDLKGQAIVYEYLGIVERNWGNLGGALEILFKGLALTEQTTIKEIKASSNYQIAVTYKHLGDFEKALDYLYQAIAASRDMNNRLFEAYAINVIGSIYFETGDYKQALDYYLQALGARQEAGDKWGEAGSLDNIGFTYLKLQNYQPAMEYCKKSLEITRSTGDKKGQANTLLHLAEIYKQSNNAEQAARSCNESLQIRQASGDKRGEAEILLFLADLHKQIGNADNDSTYERLSTALKIAEEIKALDLLSKTRFHLYEYYKQKGNFEAALNNLDLHTNLEKEFHKNSINQKVANLETSHKAEAISQRNKELTELNEKIEKANEELKVEASLERVRAVAMGMKEPADMINVCRVISDQLLQLGFKEIRNVQTVIIYQHKHEYLNYQYFTPYDKQSIETIDYRLHPDVLEFTNQMLSSPDAYYYKAFEGEDLKVWREYRRQTNQLDDPKLDEAISSHYYFYSIGSGALGVTTYAPLSEKEISLFKRFRNVFDLAYRRFIDIEKAQAQTREAQIEAALERVRAKSMAMHHSDDLISVINIVQEQLLGLGFHFHAANFVTDYSEKGYTMWLASPGESFPYKIYVPQVGLKYFEAVNAEIEKGSDFATYALNFEEKNIYFENLFENSLARNTSEGSKRMVFESKGMAASVVLLNKVRLNLMNLDLIPFTDEENNILRRFGYVFEQSYTRFLDLQKAEAQAREAQIQLAMERVRARTMAMQRSEELAEVATVLFQQVKALGVSQWVCGFSIWEPGDKEFTWYPGGPDGVILAPCKVPLTEHPVFISYDESKRRGDELFVYEKEGEFQADHYRYMMSIPCMRKLLQNMLDAGLSIPSFQIDHIANFSHGNLIFITYEHFPEMHDIFKRFAKVFEQTYTRFLDLQKAEAQAREAQIEVALERIRARAMAMHSSDELIEVANILREQMGLLGQPELETSVVNLYDEQSGQIYNWNAFRQPGLSSGAIITSTSSFSKDSSELTREMITLFQAGEKEFTLTATGSKLMEFFQVLIKSDPVVANYAGRYVPEQVFYHFTAFTGGTLLTVSYQPPSEETKLLQRRAASVFDMAYRRYLDLKKAEAQTREAQIEIAVERVRANALAMHKSEEILSVVAVLRNELLGLKIPGVSGTTIYLKQEDGRIRMWDLTSVIELEDGFHLTMDIVFQLEKTHPELYIRKLWNATEKYSVQIQNRNDLMRTVEWLAEYKKEEAENVKRFIETSDLQSLFHSTVPLAHGKLSVDLMESPPAEMETILQKMATAFDLAYKRFLDLQKAEAQAREAQIETGLERVRSKTMAMHKSEEVTGVAVSLNEELLKLGFEGGSTIIIINRETGDTEQWTGFSQDKSLKSCYVPYFRHPCHDALLDAWKRGEKFLVYTLAGDEKRTLDEHYFTTGYKIFPESDKKWMKEMESVTFSHAFMKYGAIHWGPDHLTEEQLRILQRFSKVFEQSYTRFLDLQKAEAQAREAQIEAALERVRAKVMAMTNSKDLNETSLVFGEQLRKLGIGWQFSYFWLVDEAKNENVFWITWPDYKTSFTTYTLKEAEEYFNDCLISWRAGVKIHDNYVPPEGVQEWLDTFQRIADDAGGEAKKIMLPQTFANGVYYYDAMMKYGSFGICINKPATDEEKKIQCRFAIEFERAYTRFLDLKQAEAQAREAQIELGLERVRARAMAMQKSDELKELIATVSTELSRLDITLDRCFIMTYDIKTSGMTWWMANPETSSDPIGLYIKYHEHAPYLAFLNAWENRIVKWQYILEGQVKKTWDEFLFVETDLSKLPGFVIDNMRANEKVYLSASFNNFGCLTLATLKSLSDEQFDIMLRFAKVFDLTYTRFNDLKQAEAQAREAKIEAALERVRSKAMAMHKSEDLNPAVATVFEELDKLNIGILRCGIAIMDKEKPRADVWITVKSEQANTIQVSGDESLDYHPLLQGAYDAWVKQEDFSYVLQGEDLLNYYRDVASIKYQLPVSTPFDKEKIDQQQYYFNAVFQDGSLFAFMETEITDEAKMVMKRFANVFNLTYKRFLDLQKAEAQTREALIEGALERVRARALAMQQPEELKAVAEVLRIEMGLLGIEELETCSIYINDVSADKAECWYALKDIRQEEKNLVNDHFALSLNDTWVGRQMLSFYDSNEKQTSIVMQGENRKEWIRYCEEKSVPFRGYYGEVIPDRTYHLYKFSHGAIGAASAGDISAESWRLLSRAASVFSLAYSRFKDLTQARIDLVRLKEEKQRAEEALSDLQATQKQLIQSEKMASLGELTAGIAHEIQNPLNFVNNFSDVSNELLEEMKQELSTGNREQAIEIVNNVKENLEKILHHGKRADAIVKSMLQHSRSSAGKKEPTDINSLAEEYFRLAFHGLRAKDKSFNAKFETNLDTGIGKINVISQDVGRVILNLINNAFYAVNEKKNKNGNGYEPMVTIATKKLDDRVEIKVKDNGDGIPQKVLDKIFQPFFTTKPTGQGTGLGLSLSYDIITKGHGGELLVKTKEGEGSEFIISLPVN